MSLYPRGKLKIVKKESVVKSGRKRQQETDSCISSREDTVVSVTLSSSLSVAVPSFFLSLSFRSSPSFLPSFLLFPCDVTRSSGKCTQNKKKITPSAVTVRICIIVISRNNLHTCKLPLAGSRFPLVKYARGSHIGFHSTSQTRSCALRMPRYVTFTLLPDLGITHRTARSRSFESATSSERNSLGNVVVLGRVSGPTLTTVAVVAF